MRRWSGLWRDEIRDSMNRSIGEAAFLAELEDGQFLVGEILRTSGNAEVGDGFQRQRPRKGEPRSFCDG